MNFAKTLRSGLWTAEILRSILHKNIAEQFLHCIAEQPLHKCEAIMRENLTSLSITLFTCRVDRFRDRYLICVTFISLANTNFIFLIIGFLFSFLFLNVIRAASIR